MTTIMTMLILTKLYILARCVYIIVVVIGNDEDKGGDNNADTYKLVHISEVCLYRCCFLSEIMMMTIIMMLILTKLYILARCVCIIVVVIRNDDDKGGDNNADTYKIVHLSEVCLNRCCFYRK